MAAKTKTKYGMLAATGLLAAILCSPALAQTVSGTTDTKTEAETKAEKKAEENSTLVIVRGVRGSLNDSANKKRKSKQISDSVSAEDAGKLPDNNVTEALAHVTGIQITRKHGEGADLAIRGIQEVGTTVNGNAVGGGNLRSLNHNAENGSICTTAINYGQCQDQGPTLSDVPAALIKSVTVYKTRTADQVEGGTGGVVNVELRRPLDLNKGWTVAGSYRDAFSSIGNTESPTSSLLAANRFDTPIGEMGWLVNLGYSKNRYEEQHLVTETPMTFYSGQIEDADGNLTNASGTPYMTAYRVWNGVQKGTNSRPTVNAAYQWKPNDNLDFVLEGTWFGSRESGENDYLSLKTAGDWAPIYSDIVTAADGVTLQSMTVAPSTASSHPFEILGSYWRNKSDTYTTNFETHYHKDHLVLNGSLQYNWTTLTSTNVSQDIYVDNVGAATVNFNDPAAQGVVVTLQNDAALQDVDNYSLWSLHNQVDNSSSRDFNGQLDLTYSFDNFPITSVQAGYRLTSHFMQYHTAYRDAFPGTPLSEIPTGENLIQSSLDAPGFSTSSFYHLDNKALLADWSDVLTYMEANKSNTVKGNTDDWTTADPSDKDFNSYSEKEFTAAWYGQLNYAFKAYFPVDGVVGVRVVNTNGESTSAWFGKGNVSPDCPTGDVCIVPSPATYRDILPSYNATIHFRNDLQLRLAYTYSVQRPAFSQLAGGLHLSYGADSKPTGGWGGNPELQPMKGPNYDASLEYYFGKGGVVSFAAYLKKPENSLIYYQEQITLDGATFPLWSTFNAGQATYQGYEFNAQGFFDFLPGVWKHFGGGFNFTYNQIFKQAYTQAEIDQGFPASADAAWTSKVTYNIQLYYDTPKFNARVAYNYRSKYRSDINGTYPDYTYTNAPTNRLDASFAWTPFKNWTFTLEGTNLGNNNQVGYYGYQYFPAETRLQARTVSIGARFRY